MIVMLLLIMSAGAVCAADDINDESISYDGQDKLEITQDNIYMSSEASFTKLTNEIENSGAVLNLNQDYAFNNERVDNYKEIISDDNPNKELTDDDLKNDSVIYLTNGEYDYKQEYEHKNITVIGEDASKTIINGNGRTIHISEFLSINNLTLKNIKVYAPEDLSATNVIFRDYKYNDSEMYYTGMIYNDYGDSSNINIVNCTFYNNTMAEYGLIEVYDSALNIKDSKIIANKNVLWNGYDLYGLIYATYSVFNISNSEFNNNTINSPSGVFCCEYTPITMTNCRFVNNTANSNACIRSTNRDVIIDGCEFINNTGKTHFGSITINNGNLYISNSNFVNNSAIKRGGSICHTSYSVYDLSVDNCTFYDSKAQVGGAIYTYSGNININDCKFYNCQATNGGAISFDNAYGYASKLFINITSTEFIDCYSKSKGGAIYCQRSLSFNGFNLSIVNAVSKYGAGIYSEYCNAKFDNLNMINSSSDYAGAFFLETGYLTLTDSLLSGNTGDLGSSLYLSEIYYALIENNTFINDNISTNNTLYATIQAGEGLQLTLLNNTISIDSIPKKFDLRDWEWVSPIRNQGWMGSCWTFGMTGTLESALLKATGIAADLSENNMQNTMLKYSTYGATSILEGGGNLISVGYLLSWFGAFIQDADTYDEMGKLSPLITTNKDIHVQDVMFTPNNEIPDGTQLKLAIMKYGSIDASYNGQSTYNEVTPYYNPSTYAQYVNDSSVQPNHEVSIVGWDDNFPKEKFGITPPGDGAWIVKNSWGSEWGEDGYLYVSYYDKTLLKSDDILTYATSIIIENTVPYNKNYQYDMYWGGDFVGNETVRYMNVFEALGTDAIAAVGTYFNQSGINYTVEIYVNDVLKLTQEGVSPYYGYHTIKLNEYIPIKEGDIFKAVITSNCIPRVELGDSRVHYTNNISFISFDGKTWDDAYELDYIACLKVYTVALPFYTEDLVKIYKNDSKFEAEIGVANETVIFEINGKNYTRTSDENGTARMAINLNPSNYTIKTTFNGTTVENSIVVLPTLIADNLVKYFRNASQFYISLIDGNGNPVAGKIITMNINGVFYNRTTNENGTAKLNPGEYILTATDPLTGLMMSYNITVLPTLNATDLEMKYRDGSKFMVSVLDGQGKPLANAKVTFNINGVLYIRTSDSEGIAKLNINLMAGEYIITSEYDGLRISNTITIKD